MRRFAVLVTLALSFVAPVAIPAAQASATDGAMSASSDSSCRRRRAKKQPSENKDKGKKKDGKKPYGFEL